MAEMTLKEFVRDTLIGVSEGVKEANEKLKERGLGNFSLVHNGDKRFQQEGVEFDVGLAVSSDEGSKARLGVSVLALGAATEGESSKAAAASHRVKFRVALSC